MNSRMYIKTIFFFTLAGLLFSGYLSAVKFFTDTCALNEPCPYFLGYPACWYGFAMFLSMFAITLLSLFGNVRYQTAIKTNTVISFIGILFAGRFALQEIMRSQATGVLGLSTCIYGLIFYIVIFTLCLLVRKRR